MQPIGLNPYGLAYSLGIQGAGTSRANPNPISLADYIDIAKGIGSGGIEFHAEHLFPLTDQQLANLRTQFDVRNWWVVLARPLMIDAWDQTLRVAQFLKPKTIRMHCTSILCGDRVVNDCNWPALVKEVGQKLTEASKLTVQHNLQLAIENHQDFGSSELLDLCESCGQNIGIALDTANPLSVAEDPLDFAKTVAPKVFHVHLKDYRAHWSNEGYRLIRCPTGDGCIPFQQIAALFTDRDDVTAAIEIGSLNARHIRVFDPGYWTHHPPRAVEQFSKALAAARVNRYPEQEDWQTPWEKQATPEEIIAYEIAQVRKSAKNLQELSLM
jgi:sugar phosphate isomerase/epimerase